MSGEKRKKVEHERRLQVWLGENFINCIDCLFYFMVYTLTDIVCLFSVLKLKFKKIVNI